jgi:hypothetical protein
MKEGFLFGLGFSAAYFSFHYGCQTAVYLLNMWNQRMIWKKQMKEAKAAQMNQQAQGKMGNFRDLTN